MGALVLTEAPTREQLIAKLETVPISQQAYIASLAPEKLQRIQNSVNSMRHGLQSVAPMMCVGPERCLFIEHCPIPPRNKYGAPVMRKDKQVFGPITDYPIARPCVMEGFYMQQKIVDYVKHLGVDPSNPIEMAIVNELATLDLLKNRALMVLGKGDKAGQGQDFLRVDITGFSENGTPSESTSLHPAAEYLDKIEKRRVIWLDRLVETRKSKIDAAHKMGTTNKDSQLLQEIQELRGMLEGVSVATLEAGVEDVMEVDLDD